MLRLSCLGGCTMRVLVIEDDPVATKLVELALRAEGITCVSVGFGERGVELAMTDDFDMIVLDISLPDMDGYEVVRRLRYAHVRLPVLILSAKSDPLDKVKGLEDGADDFLSKPFNGGELVARVQAIVRRTRGCQEAIIRTGNLLINTDARLVEVRGVRLQLTGKEYRILELLALRKGTTLTKDMFLDHLYGGVDEPELKIIDVFVCKLRKKIAAANRGDSLIATVWGRGYVLKEALPVDGSLGVAA